MGFLCMHGNVEEWVSDWYGDYNTLLIDPVGPLGGTEKVIRGGRYSSSAANIRSADRDSFDNNLNNARIGFRLALKKVE